ncbi:MAG: response regulator [Phycisphaerae bacterium]|nr:response regulator transcription factor [Phycisphaerae bacterium]NIP55051.1 response regulator transcription factor [Phycisphaerae bacterium]NIS53761.1 response regulator transcription factor [Phycisphaerae bacterium]NIU11339.1 response regulator transcription factor [Phycisphaerae bacterium]NIU57469.1 response regulator [Phycisphaerae bacterium]
MARKKEEQIQAGKGQTKVLIVDDHPIIRQGLAELINNEPDLTVCGQAEDAPEAMEKIKDSEPDMVIVDISLKKTSGMELIKDIKAQYPNLPVLVLSMHDEALYAERMLRAGAKGYVMKAEATEKVIVAIRKILSGQIYVSDNMAAKMVRKLVGGSPDVGVSAIERLSDRELEVFHLIGQGYGTRQIAERLHLSIKTIETYREHIKEKLNLADSSELLQYAIQWTHSKDK